LVPGSATECSITIQPHWREPITPDELRAYDAAEVIWQGKSGSGLGWLTDAVPRQLPPGSEGDAVPWALRFDAASQQIFVRCVPDICWICPSRRLVSLRYDHMLPAKGPRRDRRPTPPHATDLGPRSGAPGGPRSRAKPSRPLANPSRNAAGLRLLNDPREPLSRDGERTN
jgi:hypothetical protein